MITVSPLARLYAKRLLSLKFNTMLLVVFNLFGFILNIYLTLKTPPDNNYSLVLTMVVSGVIGATSLQCVWFLWQDIRMERETKRMVSMEKHLKKKQQEYLNVISGRKPE